VGIRGYRRLDSRYRALSSPPVERVLCVMPDLPHDSALPKPTLLAEYRPPDFMIDEVDLSFSLGVDETIVTSILVLRRNLAANTPDAPLRLDGEEWELVSVALDGAPPLDAGRCRIEPDGALIIPGTPDAFRLE